MSISVRVIIDQLKKYLLPNLEVVNKNATYPKEILCATSNDCQYSSGEKKVVMRKTEANLTNKSSRKASLSMF